MLQLLSVVEITYPGGSMLMDNPTNNNYEILYERIHYQKRCHPSAKKKKIWKCLIKPIDLVIAKVYRYTKWRDQWEETEMMVEQLYGVRERLIHLHKLERARAYFMNKAESARKRPLLMRVRKPVE